MLYFQTLRILRVSRVSLPPVISKFDRKYNYMAPTPWTTNAYPKAPRLEHVDVYKSEKKGQVNVHDPYRWLETYSEETEKWGLVKMFSTRANSRPFRWIDAQAKITSRFLDQNVDREKLEKSLTQNTDYAKVRGYLVLDTCLS